MVMMVTGRMLIMMTVTIVRRIKNNDRGDGTHKCDHPAVVL